MNELDLEIGRTLGASAFFIYQYIKANPGATSTDIQVETGLSENCVWMHLGKLRDTNVVTWEEKQLQRKYKTKVKMYKENEDKMSWQIH